MTTIAELPQDDVFRVVKWIDKFELAHLTTRSASVTIRLQRLPFTSHAEINRLTQRAAVDLLAPDPATSNHLYSSIKVHVGLLPHFCVGKIYQGQRYVGDLPTITRRLSLPEAEDSACEICVGEELERPANWTVPYRLIHAREFGGVQSEFSASRCLVFNLAGGVECIIPRTVIFQAFYAVQREMANAFTSGPWALTKSRIVYEGTLKSGLKTQVDPDTGAWHLILQTHIKDDFDRIVALLYFDDFARSCADSIYSDMLADRGVGTLPWFASAKLPFRAESNPLLLEVKGFLLAPRRGKNTDGTWVDLKQIFLVTSILGSSFPSYAATIKSNRLNSGDKGLEQVPATGERPFNRCSQETLAGSDVVTTSAVDASAAVGALVTLAGRFSWLNGSKPEKIVKDSSQIYDQVAVPLTGQDASTESGGERTFEKGNAAPAEHKMIVRDPINRFTHLLNAFDALVSSEELDTYSVFQPKDPTQIVPCGAVICWNFIDEYDRSSGEWPKSGWRIIERAQGIGKDRTLPKPRCVLVVRIEFSGHIGFWFEIEVKNSDGLLSPVIVDTRLSEQTVVQHIVESIAQANGANLREVSNEIVKEIGGVMHCYRHDYNDNKSSQLDINSIRRFLQKFDHND